MRAARGETWSVKSMAKITIVSSGRKVARGSRKNAARSITATLPVKVARPIWRNMARNISPKWAKRAVIPPKSDRVRNSIAALANWAVPPGARRSIRQEGERPVAVSDRPLSLLPQGRSACQHGEQFFGVGQETTRGKYLVRQAQAECFARVDGLACEQQAHGDIGAEKSGEIGGGNG